MATNIILSLFGPPEQKHPIKVPPMQTLGGALAAAAAKFRPPLVPEQCSLVLNKKALDLNTPFRLLNVPAGSKLDVVVRRGPAAAAATHTSAPPATATATATSSAPVQAPASTPPAGAAAAGQGDGAGGAASTAAKPAAAATAEAAAAAATSRQASSSAAGAAPKPPPAPAAPAAPSAASPAAASPAPAAVSPAPAASAAAATAAAGPLAALGVQAEVFVFHQRTLEAAAAHAPSPMELDPPDEFFELTPDDLVRLQQQANEKKKQSAMFRTRASREAEAAARASSLGPVPVRLHFPDATIVQASFPASAPLSEVAQLVGHLALPHVAPALHLYTTPPKTLLKDLGASLAQLQLVPAAHLYVGVDAGKVCQGAAAASGAAAGSLLRPEVLALMQDSLPAGHQQQQQQQGQGDDAAAGGGSQGAGAAAADAQRMMAAAAAASRSEAGSSSRAAGAGGAKVPKWMKLGGK